MLALDVDILVAGRGETDELVVARDVAGTDEDDRTDVVEVRIVVVEGRADDVEDRAEVVDDRAAVVDDRAGVVDDRADEVEDRMVDGDDRADVVEERGIEADDDWRYDDHTPQLYPSCCAYG